MSKIKTIGASPLTGTIYHGTLDTDKNRWVGQKKDITDLACRAVAEHLKVTKQTLAYGLSGGGFIILKAEVVDELPDFFKEEGGAG